MTILFENLDLFRTLLLHIKTDLLKNSNLLYFVASRETKDETHLEMVKDLIDHGFDVNAREREGQTPLHASATAGQLSTCLLLLSRGADPSVITNDPKSPDDYAALKYHKIVSEFLKEYKTEDDQKRKELILKYAPRDQKLASLIGIQG